MDFLGIRKTQRGHRNGIIEPEEVVLAKPGIVKALQGQESVRQDGVDQYLFSSKTFLNLILLPVGVFR